MTGIEIVVIVVAAVGAAIAAIAAAIGLSVAVAIGVYILLEMLSILIIAAYFIAIPVVFFFGLLAMPFILAIGLPTIGPLILLLTPRLTFLHYIYECFCKCFSCLPTPCNGSCPKTETVQQPVIIQTNPSNGSKQPVYQMVTK